MQNGSTGVALQAHRMTIANEGADIRVLTKRLWLQVDDAIDRMAEGLNSVGPA